MRNLYSITTNQREPAYQYFRARFLGERKKELKRGTEAATRAVSKDDGPSGSSFEARRACHRAGQRPDPLARTSSDNGEAVARG